jgi:hypothetical protein
MKMARSYFAREEDEKGLNNMFQEASSKEVRCQVLGGEQQLNVEDLRFTRRWL